MADRSEFRCLFRFGINLGGERYGFAERIIVLPFAPYEGMRIDGIGLYGDSDNEMSSELTFVSYNLKTGVFCVAIDSDHDAPDDVEFTKDIEYFRAEGWKIQVTERQNPTAKAGGFRR